MKFLWCLNNLFRTQHRLKIVHSYKTFKTNMLHLNQGQKQRLSRWLPPQKPRCKYFRWLGSVMNSTFLLNKEIMATTLFVQPLDLVKNRKQMSGPPNKRSRTNLHQEVGKHVRFDDDGQEIEETNNKAKPLGLEIPLRLQVPQTRDQERISIKRLVSTKHIRFDDNGQEKNETNNKMKLLELEIPLRLQALGNSKKKKIVDIMNVVQTHLSNIRKIQEENEKSLVQNEGDELPTEPTKLNVGGKDKNSVKRIKGKRKEKEKSNNKTRRKKIHFYRLAQLKKSKGPKVSKKKGLARKGSRRSTYRR